MKILKEEVLQERNFILSGEISYEGVEVDDALIKGIDSCEFSLKVLPINEDEILLDIAVNAKVKYLDARTLNELLIDIDFDESIPFSFNKEYSEELDVDYFSDELDLKELVFELIIVNTPFNYSEEKNNNVLDEASFYEDENRPFKDILKK